jgi:hypothetical protein
MKATVLRSWPAQRVAEGMLRVLDVLGAAAERVEIVRVARWILGDRGVERFVAKPAQRLRREIVRLAKPHAARTSSRRTTDKPMPEMIRTTGGKRVPGSVANRAVKRSGGEFRVKKGKK